MNDTRTIKFIDGTETLTLWPEKTVEDGWVVGWCPERQNNMVVNPANILRDDEDEA